MSQRAIETATLLFTDIEGSTRLVQHLGEAFADQLAEHRQLIGASVEGEGGRIFGTEGDALFCLFAQPVAALRAAAAAQRALLGHAWPPGAEVRVRMGVHTGEIVRLADADDYVGLALHEVARISSAAHGGMVLVSRATRELLGEPPEGLDLRDLGERRLKDLAMPERLYQLVAAGLPEDFPPLRTLDARPNNLPVQLTSFVGRQELAAVREALAGTRLLTLTGPGGTGKTRIALQLAADVSDDFPDGVYFVPLESVREPKLVLPAIATALGLAESGRPPMEQLVDQLGDRLVLLVLDNLEQVVEAGSLIAQLLREAREMKVIVTSRIVLRVYGEQEYPVPPLPLPDAGRSPTVAAALRSEAVLLFVERARSVQPAFTLDDANIEAAIEITRQLEGLPLAIELAAARVRILPLAALRARLGSRLATLTGGARDLPARQQTLRGAIDWSYELLDEPDRRLFQRFAVFASGAFLAEAEQVCGPVAVLGQDVLDGLSSLAEKSLLRAQIAGAEEPRFTMLATIREYALERLAGSGEEGLIADRHAAVYLALVERCAPFLTGGTDRSWLDRLEADHDNLRAALDRLVWGGQAEPALRFLAAVWRYWQRRGHLYEARERVERVWAMDGVDAAPVAVRVKALGAAGSICYWQGDYPAAHSFYGRALEAAREAGDRTALAEALYNRGFVPLADAADDYGEQYRAGRPFFEQSLALYRELGDRKGVADSNWALSFALAAFGDVESGMVHAQAALNAYRELGDSFGAGWAGHVLASYQMQTGRFEEAGASLREALGLFARSGDPTGIVLLLLDFSLLALREGDASRHWRLAGAGRRLIDETGVGLADTPVEFLGWYVPDTPQDDPVALEAWTEGLAMTTEQAVRYALGSEA